MTPESTARRLRRAPSPSALPSLGPPRAFGIELLNNRYPALHGIRVLAILLVIQLHLTIWFRKAGFNPIGKWQGLSANAWPGMDLFFILSGFLIGTILLHSGGVSDRRKLVRFYLRRALRILPLYYVVLAILVAWHGLTPQELERFPRELFYLTNYPFRFEYVMEWSWSLSLEEHFYLAVPVVILLLHLLRSHRARIAVLVAAWASALGVRLAVYALHPGAWTHNEFFREIYTPTHARYDTLIAGILIAYLHFNFKEVLTGWFRRAWVRRVSLLLPLAFLAVVVNPFDPGVDVVIFRSQWLRHVFYLGTATSLVYGPLLLWALCARDRWTKILGARFFLLFASLGYGVYLVHVPVLEELVCPLFGALHRRAIVPGPVLWLAALAVTVGVSVLLSWGLHLVVERPALWLRQRFVASDTPPAEVLRPEGGWPASAPPIRPARRA